MLVRTFASAVFGISASTIRVEVQVSEGIGYFLVGLPDNAIRESQQRIVAALSSLDYRWPGKRVVINLAPADVRKEGSGYDLPLAVGILGANEKLKTDDFDRFVIMGELSLDGGLQPVTGVLPMAMQAKMEGFEGIIIPLVNAREAAVVEGLDVYGMNSLSEVISFFTGGERPEPIRIDVVAEFQRQANRFEPDFQDVKGQENVKRALEVAVAGGQCIDGRASRGRKNHACAAIAWNHAATFHAGGPRNHPYPFGSRKTRGQCHPDYPAPFPLPPPYHQRYRPGRRRICSKTGGNIPRS